MLIIDSAFDISVIPEYEAKDNLGAMVVNRQALTHGVFSQQVASLYLQSDIVPPGGSNYYVSMDIRRLCNHFDDNNPSLKMRGFELSLDVRMPDETVIRKRHRELDFNDLLASAEIIYHQILMKWNGIHERKRAEAERVSEYMF